LPTRGVLVEKNADLSQLILFYEMITLNLHNYFDKVTMQMFGNISAYLDKSLGLRCHFDVSDGDLSKSLPIYLRKSINLKSLYIEDCKCIIAEPAIQMKCADLNGAVKEIKQRLGYDVVLCLASIDSVMRRAFINARTAFLVPGKQVYLPFLYMIFNDRGMHSITAAADETLSPSAQMLLLFHLQVKSLDNMSLREVASILGYSAKTVSVILPELVDKKLCDIVNDGRQKRLCFTESRKELWQKSKPYLQTPVKRIAYTDELPNADMFRYSYDSAMSHYSFLAQPRQMSIAVPAGAVKQISLHPTEGACRVEVWKYDPTKLSSGEYTDILSLILSYKGSNDERIAKEIAQLENKIV
jgi:DNA-binding MarR family transcriptional regulator